MRYLPFAIRHSFEMFWFFLWLAITDRDKDFRQVAIFHSSRAPSSVDSKNCSSLTNWAFGGVGSEKAMAPHSSTLASKIPWMEEPGRLQSVGSLESDTTERLHFHFSLSCIGEGNGNPLQCSCLENPRDRGAWWAAVHGVAQSRTRLKRLSSSSSRG